MGLDIFTAKRKVRVIMVGLDGSGKSTIVRNLQGKLGQTVPTVGFGKQEFQFGDAEFQAIDMSGQSKYRGLWASYSATVDAVVFVVDSTDRLRFKVAAEELRFLVDSQLSKTVPFLFFINKTDHPESANPTEIINLLNLTTLSNPHFVQRCSAVKGEGVLPGFQWLDQQLRSKQVKE